MNEFPLSRMYLFGSPKNNFFPTPPSQYQTFHTFARLFEKESINMLIFELNNGKT